MLIQVTQVVEGVLRAMGIPATVEVEEVPHKGFVLNIAAGPQSFLLIGHRGEHLHALEVLLHSIVRKQVPAMEYFSLDVDDYRRKREWYLKETVQGAVEHLQRTGRHVGLVPMPNYERRFVHAYVQERFPGVVSESAGEGIRRRVVLRAK